MALKRRSRPPPRDTLARQDYGRWLLGMVALGLTAYGLLSLVEARYRRIT